MEVTNVRFFSTNNGSQVGYGSITLDGEFAVNYSLMNGRSGMFVSFPSRKGRDGKYYDEAFPLSKELRQRITDAVIAASQQAAPAQQPAQTSQPQTPVQPAQPTAPQPTSVAPAQGVQAPVQQPAQPTPAAPAQAVQTPQQPAQPQPEAPQGADPAGSWGW